MTVQKSDVVISLGTWVDEGDTFSLEKVSKLSASGSVFVNWFKVRGNVLTEQAKAILLRDNFKISTHRFKFHILKGSIIPSRKRNMNNVLNEKAVFGLEIPDSSAVRLFFDAIRAGDMAEMGFKNIILPREEKVRGGVFHRLIIRRQENFLAVGTYTEEKKDKWNNDTGFLFVE